jgi:hypothetical protein
MFLFVHAKPFISEYNKRKIPILYCTTNQLIEVKVGFAFGYRTGSAGKYLVPKMHLTQLKIINSIMIYLYQSNLFPRSNCFCHENKGFVHHLNHAWQTTVRSFFAGNSPTDDHPTSVPYGWSCYWGSTVGPMIYIPVGNFPI